MLPNHNFLEFSRSSNFKLVSKIFTIVVIFNAFMMLTIYLVNGSNDIKFDTYYSKSSMTKKIAKSLISTSINSSFIVKAPPLVKNQVSKNITNNRLFTEHLRKHILMQSRKNGPWYMFHELVKRTKHYENYFDIFPAMVLHNDVLEFEARNIKNHFPLAFSHLIHKHVAILEVFLSLYFRPNNFHCIHLDSRSPMEVRNVVSNLVKSYSRKSQKGSIFLIPQNESFSVGWGEGSMLAADLTCIKKLLEFKENGKTAWWYLFSVAGTELPTRSYWKFHQKLSQTLGRHDSSVESQPVASQFWSRFSTKQISARRNVGVENGDNQYEFELNYNKDTNITFQVFKGTRNVILSAKDAEFLCYHPLSNILYNWFLQGYVPDEHFYATMIRFKVDTNTNKITQNTKGKIVRYHGGVNFTEGNTLHGICPRYTLWYCDGCHGQCIRWICNFNRLDLEKIKEEETECLIANKFNFEVDPSSVSLHMMNVVLKVSKEIFHSEMNNWYLSYIKKIVNIMLE